MSYELTTNEIRVPSTVNDDPFMAYANSVKAEYILGKLLKFSKGDYVAGEDDESVPHGTRMVAAMDLLTIGYVKWIDGKPVEHRMVLVASGEKPPRRGELGDDDPAQWPDKDTKGEPRDPWALTQYLPLIAEDAELFTFSTSSRGGIGALAGLARAYARGRGAHPNKFPVVQLGVDAYQHSNNSYGRIKVPTLKLVGWEDKGTFFWAAGMETPAPAVEEGAYDPSVPLPTDADFADAIPF